MPASVHAYLPTDACKPPHPLYKLHQPNVADSPTMPIYNDAANSHIHATKTACNDATNSHVRAAKTAYNATTDS